ncbi:MarR family winged helix-turn-helix transcriptional regulator [Sphingosinicella sp. LHD-64]|uniref:MarR family winged helix-turn-helix transcriptional regulator n=1 Tax=Sphingosinicella sp. LHD-64 TaxID=3072139 RepID=UPI00280D1F74|nr:MarR family winged helix-turn-helix transcriptional regulator [Sphingosinicella sp. LHD-64]MDQ8757431.1 MarR family winged helix-turn-helix transcriptional regulator [Sphingosinicella sp. LHD-64]
MAVNHADPQKSFGHQVRRCHRRFDRLLSARLAPHGLKTGFWYYLRALWIADDVTQKQLSDLTNVTETTTVSMINGMIRHGLVDRSRDLADKRKMRVKLTPEGRALEKELIGYALEINAIAMAGIAPKELATCLSVLSRMSANLQIALDETTNADDG